MPIIIRFKKIIFLFIIIILIIGTINSNMIFNMSEGKYISIKLGEPQQKIKLFVDPTLPITLIFEKNPVLSPDSVITYNYNPFKSKTFKTSHVTYTIKTIYGEFKGHFSKEYFEFDENIKLHLEFLLINEMSSQFLNCDGIIGLGIKNDDKFPELSNMNLLSELFNKKIIKEKKLIYFQNKTIIIGEIDDKNNLLSKYLNSNNKTKINIYKSDQDYPAFYSKINGIYYWKKDLKSGEKKTARELSEKISFSYTFGGELNKLIVPNSKKIIIKEYLFKFLFNNFSIIDNAYKKTVPEIGKMNKKTTIILYNLLDKNITNNQFIYYNKSDSISHFDYDIGLDIDNKIFNYNYNIDINHNIANKEIDNQSDIDISKIKDNEDLYIFNLNICKDIHDYFFLSLDYLESELTIFDFDNNNIILYNCTFCGKQVNSDSYFNIFLIIMLISLFCSATLFIFMIFTIKRKKIPHMKIIKNFHLII